MLMRSVLVALAVLVTAAGAAAQSETPDGRMAPDGTMPIKALPGTLSWAVLQGVKTLKREDGKIIPEFEGEVRELHAKSIKIRGFMVPTEGALAQKHFLLSPYPPSCPFCLTAGPDSIIDVRCAEPVKTTFDPLVVSGKLQVMSEDEGGFYYRLIEASEAE